MSHTIFGHTAPIWFICKNDDGVGIISSGVVAPGQVMDTGLATTTTYGTEEDFNAALAAVGFRVLLLVPEELDFDDLAPELQAAINGIFGQYEKPMPNTQAVDGLVIVDAVTAGNFIPSTMADYGIDWPIIGMWKANGDVVVPLDTAAYDARVIDPTQPMHQWTGWQAVEDIWRHPARPTV